MSRDLGRDVPDLEKLYARKLWADFSYPKFHRKNDLHSLMALPGCWDFLRKRGRVPEIHGSKVPGGILRLGCGFGVTL